MLVYQRVTSRSSHRESPHHYIGWVFEQVRKVNPGTSTSDKMSVIHSSPSQRLQKLKPSGYRTWNNLDPYHHTNMSHQNGTSLKLEATSNNIQEYIIHNNFENSIFCNNDKCFLSTMIATSKLLPSVQEPLKAQWRHQSKRMCRWTFPNKQWFPSILPGSSGYWWVLTNSFVDLTWSGNFWKQLGEMGTHPTVHWWWLQDIHGYYGYYTVYIYIFHIHVDRILVISCDHFYCLLSCHECSKLGLHDQIAKTFWPTICNYFHQCITASLVRLRNRGVASPRPGGERVALCHCSWGLKVCCFQ